MKKSINFEKNYFLRKIKGINYKNLSFIKKNYI